MNPINEKFEKGTFGEILVQLRLLQYGVQAAPPIKDSGNDLIAVRGESFWAIQVKTTSKNRINVNNLPNLYHILALVFLSPHWKEDLHLDDYKIFLLPKEKVKQKSYSSPQKLAKYEMNKDYVNRLFQ